MASTTKNKSRTSNQNRTSSKSAFNWNNGNTGAVVGAAVAGAAAGFAAHLGRKFVVQMTTGRTDWFESLRNDHEMVLKIFGKIEDTRDDQTMMRSMLLMQLKHALSKHALEEENVIYPALRDANEASDADHLNHDHGYIKTFLYELETMAKDSPEWIGKVREFRSMTEKHIREEEDRIFPEFHDSLTEEQNKKLTTAMHKEGLKLA